MTERLQSICGQRHTFIGVFEKSDMLSTCWHQPQPTLLFRNVTNRQGTISAALVWVSSTKQFDALGLKQGEVVCFDATVRKYMGIYRLNNPTKIAKVETPQPCGVGLSKIRNFCTKCGETRDSEFIKSRSHECKSCTHKVITAWYNKNHERCKLQGKQYYADNRDRMKTSAKAYHEKNKDKISQYYKAWYANGGRKPKTEFLCPHCGDTNPEHFYPNRGVCKPCQNKQTIARKTKR